MILKTPAIKQCEVCGGLFEKRYSVSLRDFAKQRFCSSKCRGRARRRATNRTRPCPTCGTPFGQRNTESVKEFDGRKFCSPECALRFPDKRANWPRRFCEHCTKEITPASRECLAGFLKRRFCSGRCRNLSLNLIRNLNGRNEDE